VGLLQRLKDRRAGKKAEREAIEQAREESLRVGEEREERTEAEVIEDALGRLPPPD